MAPRLPPSHYAVLDLDPAAVRQAARAPASSAAAATAHNTGSASTVTAMVRRAYRRALLRNHPDKQHRDASAKTKTLYTIDQITAAWTVLSDPARRRTYDQELAAGRAISSTSAGTAGADGGATGLEVVDLDDLAYDDADVVWYRSCRCGNPRGFVFGEADLEEAIADGEEEDGSDPITRTSNHNNSNSELLVGCRDCSLWLCVHFAVAPDEEDG